MNNKKALLGNGIIYLISTVLIKGIVFITMPLFTKILSVEDFGIYNAYMSYEAVLSIIMTIGAGVVVRSAWIEYDGRYDYFEKSLIQLLLMFFGGLALFVGVVEIVLHGAISNMLGLNELLLFCLLFHSSGYGLVIVASERYRMEYKAKNVLFLSLLLTLSSVVLSLAIIHFQDNASYIGRILGASIPYVVFWVYYFLKFFTNNSRSDKKIYKYILALGLPAVPYILSENIMLQCDRVMIERMIGAYDAGIYSAISTVTSILLLVGNSIEGVWAPWSYQAINENRIGELKRFTTYYSLVFSFLTIGFVTISPELIRLFTAKEDYWNYINLVYPLIMMQFTYFINKIPSNLLFYHKKTLYCSIGIGAAAIVNVALNYVAFMKFGFEVAAINSLVSISILTLFQYFLCRHLMISYYRTLDILIVYIGTILIIIFNYAMMETVLIRYLLATVVLLAMFVVTFMRYKKLKKGEENERLYNLL